ncbi:MAG: response regulator transcription factor [Myxococcota bacterium]
MLSILVADDHSIVREGLRRVIEAEADLEVCGEAGDGREVLDAVARRRPDFVILDIGMPGLGGLETLERLRATHPEVKVLLLSVHVEAPIVESAISLGADGYLLKDGRASEILAAVRAIQRGGNYFSPPVAREIAEQLRRPKRSSRDPFSLLSRREREVLLLIVDGMSAREIAERLGISAKTVEAHRTSLMRKLGVRKATELVRYALRHGLIEP